MSGGVEAAGTMPRSIVLVTGSLGGGGAERVLSEMADFWSGRGWSVVLATWSSRSVADVYPLPEPVRRVWLDDERSDSGLFSRVFVQIARIARLRRLLKNTRPDCVLSFITTSNVLTLLAAVGLPLNVVVSERIDPAADPSVSRIWGVLRRLTYRWADAVVAQSSSAATWLDGHCKCSTIVIPNPLRPLPATEVTRESLILAVGRLVPQKGFDILLNAFAEICGDFPGWRISIVGDGKDRDSLLELRDSLGLQDLVSFEGHVDDVEVWMARAGLVVQPSRFEGFPNVVLESMGMGAAVISADCPSGPADIIQDNVNGVLVPVDDCKALAAAMRRLLQHPGQRQSLGGRARAVNEIYQRERVMRQWDRCLLGDESGIQAA